MKSFSLVISCIVISLLFVHYVRAGFTKRVIDGNWSENNWAWGCDFPENDIKNFQIPAEECAETSGCTHFSWNPWSGGTCMLKSGSVSKDDAIEHEDKTVICGILESDNVENLTTKIFDEEVNISSYFSHLS